MKPNTELLAPGDTSDALAATAFTHLRGALHAAYATADFASAAALAAQMTELAEAANHHPQLTIGWGSLRVELSSHDAGGVTRRDVDLALQLDEAATSADASAVVEVPASYDIAVDTLDADAIRPYWAAVLGYAEHADASGEIELVDPRGRGPKVWFQQMGVARPERNRIHLDVYVTQEEARERLATVLAAGGILVTEEFAPDWWVTADVDGNEVCICTSGR